MYLDPPPINTMTATVEQRQQHTLALLADAEQALFRVRMEGTFMTSDLTNSVALTLGDITAAQQPRTAVGVGLHA